MEVMAALGRYGWVDEGHTYWSAAGRRAVERLTFRVALQARLIDNSFPWVSVGKVTNNNRISNLAESR